MLEEDKLPAPSDRVARTPSARIRSSPARRSLTRVAWWALIGYSCASTSAFAAAPITLQVEAAHGLPGLHHSALSRFLAAHMAEAGLADWRFEPAGGDPPAPDRVEWTFRFNPYAGGEVRHFVRALGDERRFGIHRPVTIEARLCLDGGYQTLVETQAIIEGGPDDPDLAEAVAIVTQNLLGPSGAYRAVSRAR